MTFSCTELYNSQKFNEFHHGANIYTVSALHHGRILERVFVRAKRAAIFMASRTGRLGELAQSLWWRHLDDGERGAFHLFMRGQAFRGSGAVTAVITLHGQSRFKRAWELGPPSFDWALALFSSMTSTPVETGSDMVNPCLNAVPICRAVVSGYW